MGLMGQDSKSHGGERAGVLGERPPAGSRVQVTLSALTFGPLRNRTHKCHRGLLQDYFSATDARRVPYSPLSLEVRDTQREQVSHFPSSCPRARGQQG